MYNLITTYLLIFLKNKLLIFLMTFASIAIMIFSVSAVKSPEKSKIIIYNPQQYATDVYFIEYLSTNSTLIETNDINQFNKCLVEEGCNVGIHLKKDIDQSIRANNVQNYYDISLVKSDNLSVPVIFDLDTLVSVMIQNAQQSESNNDFDYKMKEFLNAINHSYSVELTFEKNNFVPIIFSAINFIVIIIVLTIINRFARDRYKNVFKRIMLSKVNLKGFLNSLIIVANFIFLVFIMLITCYSLLFLGLEKQQLQFSLNLYVSQFLFFNSILMIVLLIFLLSKDYKKMSTIITLAIVPITMLGGYFWPVKIMPEYLQKIGLLLPISWSNMYLQGSVNEMIFIAQIILIVFLYLVILGKRENLVVV